MELLGKALEWWRGPSYAEFADEDWARAERRRLAELRSEAVERLAEARLALGRAEDAIPDLDAHVAVHPWREQAWVLLGLALYRAGRQGDALAVLRRARAALAEQLGVDPGPELRRLEADVLRQGRHLGIDGGVADRVWARAAAAYDHTVTAGGRARLESTVGLLRADRIGVELVDLATRHGFAGIEVLGHLVRLQARSALTDFRGADGHADALDQLADRHERPLVDVFTRWYRALRLASTGRATAAEEIAAYREAAHSLDGAGMPGLAEGLLPLALLCVALRHGEPLDPTADLGPHQPWAHPLLLLAAGRRDQAAARLRDVPDPPRDLLQEAMWCLVARAAVALGDLIAMERARAALVPAAAELAGAGSGLVTLGPVAAHLEPLDKALATAQGPWSA